MPYVFAFVPALLALLLVLDARKRSGAKWCDKLGPPGWRFSESWASSLTAILALFHALFAQNLLSADSFMPKADYAALSAMFGALVLAAPLVYLATARLKEGTELQLQGLVAGFVVGAFLVLWAVIGQLLLTALLAVDVGRQNLNVGIASVFVVLSIAALVAATVHGVRTVRFILQHLHSGALAARFEAGEAPTWFWP